MSKSIDTPKLVYAKSDKHTKQLMKQLCMDMLPALKRLAKK